MGVRPARAGPIGGHWRGQRARGMAHKVKLIRQRAVKGKLSLMEMRRRRPRHCCLARARLSALVVGGKGWERWRNRGA